jgi:hypothetical protein
MPRATPFDPLVFTSKTNFLQRVQEAVGDGYRFWTGGSVPPEAAPGLVRKFKAAYAIHVDKNERYRRKAAGLGNARLLMRWAEEQRIDFVLLVTPGAHPAQSLEKLRDSAHAPLDYRELELVSLTFKGRHKPSLTWRMRAETVDAWRKRLHLATAHYNRLDLFRSWQSLYCTPGFAGIRQQVGALVSYWRAEWRQHRRDDPCPICYPHSDMTFRARPGVSRGENGMYWTERGFPSPAQCPKLFYIRKQADVGQRLSSLMRTLA